MRLALRKRPEGPLSLKPVGDQAVLAELGTEICEETSRRVMELYDALEQMRKRQEPEAEGILEMVPAYASLLVYYDPAKTDYARAAAAVEQAARRRSGSGEARGRLLRIPVCYGGGFGEDLEEAAALARMTPEDLIRIHSGRDYRVYMLGFLPGFPYLGGMDPAIAVPRKQTPRTGFPPVPWNRRQPDGHLPFRIPRRLAADRADAAAPFKRERGRRMENPVPAGRHGAVLPGGSGGI